MIKAKCIRNYFRCVASFIRTLLKNNNHYLTNVKINGNVGYYYLKWRDKFSVWHLARNLSLHVPNLRFLWYHKLRFVREYLFYIKLDYISSKVWYIARTAAKHCLMLNFTLNIYIFQHDLRKVYSLCFRRR